jgi:hypothetical protein
VPEKKTTVPPVSPPPPPVGRKRQADIVLIRSSCEADSQSRSESIISENAECSGESLALFFA